MNLMINWGKSSSWILENQPTGTSPFCHEETSTKPSSPSILIVDDQLDNIRTLSVMLKNEGYKVRQALSGMTALESAATLPPDLILLDIMMPQMDGYEVCAALKASEETSEVPVIFLSALSEIVDKSRAFTLGGMDYITKPFQAEEVLLRIRHQLTIRRQKQKLIEQNLRLQQEIRERHQAEAIIQRQVSQERLLGEIIRHIRQSLQLNEILGIAAEEIRQLLQVDRVLILRFNPDWSSEVVVESTNAESLLLSQQTLDDPRCQQYWAELFSQGSDRFNQELQTSKIQQEYAEFLASHHIVVSLSFPVPHLNDPWGIVIAHHQFTPRAWGYWELEFLQQFTAQLAIAISHCNLYQNLEEQVQERTIDLQHALEFETLLKRITDKVRDSLDEHHILQTAVEELATGLGVVCCETSLYNAELTTATITHENAACLSPALGQISEIDADGLYAQLLQHQTVQFCSYQTNPGHPGYERYSVLICPVFESNRILGDLRLFQPEDLVFDPLAVRLVKQVANQCAIALRQARLYQAAQAQVRELQKLNQLKDDFLSTISHELRTPIANIKMVVRLLLTATGKETHVLDEFSADASSNKVAQYLAVLEDECERELRLIQDLLNLQHLEAGTQPLELTTLNLNDWIPYIVESFDYRTRAQQQTLQVTLDPSLPALTTDTFCLNRILTELISNACKYTPVGGIITVAVTVTQVDGEAKQRPDRSADPKPEPESSKRLQSNISSIVIPNHAIAPSANIVISVTNSGAEILAPELERIFDKFYRIPNNDPWKQGGTGLGLALVKKMVEHLQGAIAVTSEHHLTCFTVTLPTALDLA